MWLKIKPQDPLILGEVRADSQFLTSQLYTPGRVLRGAWAEWLLRQGFSDGKWILARVNRLHIGNFFPAAEWASLKIALPLPMSALSCKQKGGFQTEPGGPDSKGHGVVDTLLPHLAYRLLQEAGGHFPVPFALSCRQCHDRMEPFSGFYALYHWNGEERLVHFRSKFHSQTKVALSRYRRASAEGMLYTASALSPWTAKPDEPKKRAPLILVGRVTGDPQALDELRQALQNTPLGALHTRGYGRIRVEDADVILSPLGERLDRFNACLAELWQDLRRLATNANALPEKPERLYFSVDLLAPGVFREDGIPSLVPVLDLAGRTLRPIFWMTRPDMASGWSAAWGLPKLTNLAAHMGSVYVFRWDGSSKDLIPVLQTLEEEGVGERRDESFGECLICHPFHQEVEER